MSNYFQQRIVTLPPEQQFRLMSMYQARRPKSTSTAFFINLFTSPVFAYLYLGKPLLAVMAFLSALPFGIPLIIWWVINMFTLHAQVESVNRQIADEILAFHT